MGVEYSHGLFVSDLTFKPGWNHLVAIHDVLVKWNLAVKGKHDLYDLDDDGSPITAKAAQAKLPANLLAMYRGAGAVAAALMGPSQYDIADDDRDLQGGLAVILGVDFKVLLNEDYEVEITTPAKNGTKTVERNDFRFGGHWLYQATWDTKPPKTKAPGGFSGVWRSGVVVDCGKDLPAITDGMKPLPAKGFRAALEKALGTKLVEQGWHH